MGKQPAYDPDQHLEGMVQKYGLEQSWSVSAINMKHTKDQLEKKS